MRQMTGSSSQRRRRKLHWLEITAIVLGVFAVGGVAAFIALVFSSGDFLHNSNQPQPYVITYIEQNDDDVVNNCIDANINNTNEETFVEGVDTDEGHEVEGICSGNAANEMYVSVEINDELTENYADDYNDAEQIPQEVRYEQINTEYETIVSEIQDAVTDLNNQEPDTNITIRFISEIGLTYDIYIPALAPSNEVRYIMLHHTYGLFETDGSLRGMHNDHRNRTATLDGGGIAYSEIIQRDGTVWIARGALRPSHTGVSLDIRTHSYSITVTGNFDRTDAIMSDVQFNSLASRVAEAMRQFPNATIVGHGDLAPTACPGRNFPWDRLEESIGAVRSVYRGENAR